MPWDIAVGLGACGGLILSVLDFIRDVSAWADMRRSYPRLGTARGPGFSKFTDHEVDFLVLVTRVITGALAGFFVHDQVIFALGVGAAAPVLLSQIVGRTNSADSEPQAIPSYEPRHLKEETTASHIPLPRAELNSPLLLQGEPE